MSKKPPPPVGGGEVSCGAAMVERWVLAFEKDEKGSDFGCC